MSTDPYVSRITRREALARVSKTAAVAACVGAGTLYFRDRRVVESAAPGLRDWRVDAVARSSKVVAARGKNPASNVRRAIEALGGIGLFVRKGESVLIKPNVGWDRLPEQAANSDPSVVAEIVRMCKESGAGRVIVADISCNDPARSFTRSGIQTMSAQAGADVIDSRALKMAAVDMAGSAAGLEVIELLLSVDRVINVPVVKHHSLSRATIGMKNWFGVLGRGRNRLHQSIHRAIAELGAVFRPTLTVVDATRILMANGPQGGNLSDVRSFGAVAAGVDPVLCDAWGATQMGLDARSLAFIVEAEQRGLGRSDLKLVQEIGTA